MKHTQGKWEGYGRIDLERIEIGRIKVKCYFIHNEVRNLATVNDGCHKGEMEANAKLIAAAPELLAALEACVACASLAAVLERKVKAAIAKATV